MTSCSCTCSSSMWAMEFSSGGRSSKKLIPTSCPGQKKQPIGSVLSCYRFCVLNLTAEKRSERNAQRNRLVMHINNRNPPFNKVFAVPLAAFTFPCLRGEKRVDVWLRSPAAPLAPDYRAPNCQL